jgi:hypothetical protein
VNAELNRVAVELCERAELKLVSPYVAVELGLN